jgi:hypothetical protein
MSVWAGGKGEHVDDAKWNEAWSMQGRHTPPIERLSEAGRRY